MRRTARAVLASAVLVGATSSFAVAPAAAVVEPGAEAPGLEPMGPNQEGNEFRPVDYEANYLWGGIVGIAGLLGGGLLLGALAWRLLVSDDA